MERPAHKDDDSGGRRHDAPRDESTGRRRRAL